MLCSPERVHLLSSVGLVEGCRRCSKDDGDCRKLGSCPKNGLLQVVAPGWSSFITALRTVSHKSVHEPQPTLLES